MLTALMTTSPRVDRHEASWPESVSSLTMTSLTGWRWQRLSRSQTSWPQRKSPVEASSSAQPSVRKREIFGWAMFDFANSSFTTVIVTTLFPIYFAAARRETATYEPALRRRIPGVRLVLAGRGGQEEALRVELGEAMLDQRHVGVTENGIVAQ